MRANLFITSSMTSVTSQLMTSFVVTSLCTARRARPVSQSWFIVFPPLVLRRFNAEKLSSGPSCDWKRHELLEVGSKNQVQPPRNIHVQERFHPCFERLAVAFQFSNSASPSAPPSVDSKYALMLLFEPLRNLQMFKAYGNVSFANFWLSSEMLKFKNGMNS